MNEYDVDFDTIESYLLKFEGGDVHLSTEYWEEGIAMLYLNHLEKRNALSGKMMVDLRKCISILEQWENGKAVLFYGMGENFCSGGDLNFARLAGTPKEGFYMSYIMQDVLKRFRRLHLVSVCLVHGPAVGGGSELALFSDYLLVADNVKLGFVHGRMGIITAWGGSTRLNQIVGARKAMEMLLSSKIYSAEECLNLGLAHKIVVTENRIKEALDFVRTLTVYDTSIIRSYKEVIENCAVENFEKALDFERRIFCPKWGSELNRKALAKNMKHVEKKKP